MDEHKMTQQEEIREREALFVLYVLAGGIVAVILWVAHSRLYLTNQHLTELAAMAPSRHRFCNSGAALLCNPPVAP